MKYTFEEKIANIVRSAVETIHKYEKDGYAPILIVFSNPKDPQHCQVRAATGIDAKQFIDWLSESNAAMVQ